MARNEDAVFRWSADTSAVDAALDQTRKAGEGVGAAVQGVLGRVDKLRDKQMQLAQTLANADTALGGNKTKIAAIRAELERTTAALNKMTGATSITVAASAKEIKKLETVVQSTSLEVQTMGKRNLKLRESLGGAATATSGVASALGNASGKAKDFIGAADNIAMAAMAGGPVAIGLTALATGVGVIATQFIKAKQKAIDFENQMRRTASFGLAEFAAEVSALEKELENVGKTGVAGRIGQQEEVFTAAATAADFYRREVAASTEALEEWTAFQRGGVSEMYGKRVDDEVARLKHISATSKANLARAEEEEKLAMRAIELLHQIGAAEGALEQKTDQRGRVQHRVNRQAIDDMTAHVEAWREMRALLDADDHLAIEMPSFEDQLFGFDIEEATKRYNEAEQEKVEASKLAAAEIVRIEQAAAAERLALQTAVAHEMAATMSFGIAATQQLIDGLITGEEQALEKAALGFTRMVGQQLIAVGTRGVVEGAIHSLNPAAPGSGAGMIAAGAAAIGVGIGMGAAATAGSHMLAGGTIGQALPTTTGAAGGSTSAASSRGLGPIGTSDGVTQTTVVYQFNAPVFGDHNASARQVSTLQERANRELLRGGSRR